MPSAPISTYRPRHIRKAIAGGLAPVVPLLAADLLDLHVSRVELGGLVAAMITGFGLVFGIRNAAAPGDLRRRGQDGAVVFDLSLIVGFLGGLFLGFLLWHR